MEMKEQAEQILQTISKIETEIDGQSREDLLHSTRIAQSILDRHFASGNSHQADLNYVKSEISMMVSKEEKDPKKARYKVIQKLISFGENVTSDILASIITNPNIWAGIAGG